MNNGIVSKTITLTPELASGYLQKIYKGQRSLSVSKAKTMADDMTGGRWNDAIHMADPLIFTAKGEMMNGQHRCKATLIAHHSITATIIENAPEEWFSYIDGGLSRSVNQFVKGKNKAVVAALAKFAIALQSSYGNSLVCAVNGEVGRINQRSVYPSRNAILNFVRANENDCEWCAAQAIKIYHNLGGGSKAAFADALWVIMNNTSTDKEHIENFVAVISSPVQEHKALAIGRELAKNKLIRSKGTKERIRQEWWVAWLLAMWEAKDTKKSTFTQKYIDEVMNDYSTIIK